MNQRNMKQFFQKYGAYLLAALVFVTITVLYCSPAFEGKVLNQSDTMQWKGMAHELKEYNAEADTPAHWTNSMFGGMPAYQITVKNPSDPFSAFISAIDRFFRKLSTLFFDSVFGLLMGYFIGFFIMLLCFGVNKWLSIIGAIALAMSSYFFLIIPAGHESKAVSLAMMAPVIGGFFLIFRKKYVLGALLVMLYSSFGLMKHPQMSYYMIMMMGLFGIAEIYIHIKEKRIKELFISLAVFLCAIGIGVGTGYSQLKANSEYVKETIRGGHSELQSSDSAPSKGLSLEYATAWSYGIDETLTLLVPGYMGGASSTALGPESIVYKEVVKQGYPRSTASQIAANTPTYWGEQPFTAGPVYVGAIICFLFLLGALLVKGPYKWALVAATLFSILLSWGHNFMGFTKLFYNFFPFYNKFRTVSSILVVAQVAMPLLAFLGLNEIISARVDKANFKRSLLISVSVTGGICLLLALLGPVFLSFSSSADANLFAGMPSWYRSAVMDQRALMLRTDAFRSLCFILASAALLFLFSEKKVKLPLFLGILGVLVLADLWPVDKRYFGEKDWVKKSQTEAYFAMQDYEKQILQDESYYRVINLTTNTFNDSRTSYYLHSVGGYHAAKLRRYQDLIDAHISKGNGNALNMLNTKYFIVKGENGRPEPVINPDALGNAWFVDEVQLADSPKEESDALWELELAYKAVTDKKFEASVLPRNDYSGQIELLSYAPDRLVYKAKCEGEKTAVFSEVYYPYGWNAYIDGQKVEHYRVNYLLRALNVPAGEHEIVFEFRPDSIYKGYKINALFRYIMYGLLFLFLIGCGLHLLGKGPKWLRTLGENL